METLRSLKSAIYNREERKMQYQSQIKGLNAYDRHNKFMKDYVEFYGKANNMHDDLKIKTDQDTVREGNRFIISEDDDMESTWEKRLVKRYYDKLFKEYCIADMSQYKQGKVILTQTEEECFQPPLGFRSMDAMSTMNGKDSPYKVPDDQFYAWDSCGHCIFFAQIGLRWRTEKEVIAGKGQFVCGNKKCNEKDGLGSYEVNFSYFEAGENKQALVKLVACKRCAEKLVYRRQKEREHSKSSDGDISKRKRGKDLNCDDIVDEQEDYKTRKKGRRTSASASKMTDADEDFEEFLEGMFL